MTQNRKSGTYKKVIGIFWPLVISFALIISTYHGVILQGDDVLYARLASDMANNNPTFFINTHTYRLGFIAPMAGLYSMFGVHDWTTVAFPVFCTLGMILLTAFAARRLLGPPAVIWSILLCATNPIVYRFGTVALADIPTGFFYGLFAVAWVLVAVQRVQRYCCWALVAGVACGLTVSIRASTGPMIVFTLMGFLILDWRRHNLRHFPWLMFCMGGCIPVLPYLGYLWWHTGTPLFALDAAQGGYNLDGAPWLKSIDGLRFWARLSGLSILRAAVEGYLFAIFPLIAALLVPWPREANGEKPKFYGHLLIAVLSPLAILSHFSTSLSHWNPVNLDLRLGSPIVVPATLLAVAVLLRLPAAPPTCRRQWVLAGTIILSTGLLCLGLSQGNTWTLCGALASLVTGLLMLLNYRIPRSAMPWILTLLLAINWWVYRNHEYLDTLAQNAELRIQAQTVPVDKSLPVLTDCLTAQFLPYVHGFKKSLEIAAWMATENANRPSYWVRKVKRPWSGSYLIVWNPESALNQARRWNETIPDWVKQEINRGRLLADFHPASVENGKGLPAPQFKNVKDSENWPKAGIYIILPN